MGRAITGQKFADIETISVERGFILGTHETISHLARLAVVNSVGNVVNHESAEN
ncbi:MAG: hypothetical protein JWN70_6533, partial [Planctomycetaceae bacterium]|nr:hypothetical protein [Planctomycetaceae bacterium]